MADEFRENEAEMNDLPERLAEDLASLYDTPVAVPAQVNDAILNRARAQLARRPRRRALRWVGAAAAAACVVFGARIALHNPAANSPDATARITILDALKLARQIEAGHGRDVNGDGVIDQKDVDTLAMMAVSLNDQGDIR